MVHVYERFKILEVIHDLAVEMLKFFIRLKFRLSD